MRDKWYYSLCGADGILSELFLLLALIIQCQVLSYKDLQTAFIKIPRLREIAYDMLLNGFINLSNRFGNLLTLSPEERYVKLLNENSQLFHKIPLKMLASYLGITDVALSRIRNRISQK